MFDDSDIDHLIETCELKKMTFIPLRNKRIREYLRCLCVYLLTDPTYNCSLEDIESVVDLVVSVNTYLKHKWETEEGLDTLGNDPSFIVCLYIFFRDTAEWFRAHAASNYGIQEHSSVALYVIFSLQGQCTQYPLYMYVKKTYFPKGHALMGVALNILYRETSFTSNYLRYNNEPKMYKRLEREFIQYTLREDKVCENQEF